MKFPKISVIIPCKNAGNTLQTTLDSIRSQCYENLECIVMDGLSTDNTVEIIRNNKDIISFYVSQEDRSPSDACNKAINMCTGDVVGFLYADDFLESDALSQIASAVTNNPEYLVYSYGLSIQHLISKKIILESYNKKNINLCLNNVLFKHVLNHFYKKEDIKHLTAKQGAVLFEDTRGMHKGQKVEVGSRLILILQYTTNLFGHLDTKIKFPKNTCQEFLDCKKNNPFFFSNFKTD